MRELGLDLELVADYFTEVQADPFLIVQVPVEVANQWADTLGEAARRCYVSDATLEDRVAKTGRSRLEIVQSRIPDPGSIMSGDFGEILTALFMGARELPNEMLDPKKWRLKQDRLAPAPKSDVVQFHAPDWPTASAEDRIVCGEVKTKATPGGNRIPEAIADSIKDRKGRLIKTLTWLREHALSDGLGNIAPGTVSLEHIERFINASDHPPAKHDFKAVVVICESLKEDELQENVLLHEGCALVVIAVPDLKARYEEVFAALVASVGDEVG